MSPLFQLFTNFDEGNPVNGNPMNPTLNEKVCLYGILKYFYANWQLIRERTNARRQHLLKNADETEFQ